MVSRADSGIKTATKSACNFFFQGGYNFDYLF